MEWIQGEQRKRSFCTKDQAQPQRSCKVCEDTKSHSTHLGQYWILPDLGHIINYVIKTKVSPQEKNLLWKKNPYVWYFKYLETTWPDVIYSTKFWNGMLKLNLF